MNRTANGFRSNRERAGVRFSGLLHPSAVGFNRWRQAWLVELRLKERLVEDREAIQRASKRRRLPAP
jgi:hypothetical protein